MKGRWTAAVLGILIVASSVSCKTVRTRVWMNEGNKLYRAQKYDEAVEFYKKIVAIDPQHWTANYLIAMSYTALYHPGSEHEKDKEYADKANPQSNAKHLPFPPLSNNFFLNFRCIVCFHYILLIAYLMVVFWLQLNTQRFALAERGAGSGVDSVREQNKLEA
jgi:tetratricopeptide (TPR) repeat protein